VKGMKAVNSQHNGPFSYQDMQSKISDVNGVTTEIERGLWDFCIVCWFLPKVLIRRPLEERASESRMKENFVSGIDEGRQGRPSGALSLGAR